MTKNRNIYHCCIQKTASQWIKRIFSDPIIYRWTSMKVYTPGKNFIGPSIEGKGLNFLDSALKNKIVTPLYIRYEHFAALPKPEDYKAFFVLRDPRDFLISFYFSTKYSHVENPYVLKLRAILNELDLNDGLSFLMEKINGEHHHLYFTMREWSIEGQKDERIKVFKYEDLTGPEQLNFFIDLFRHLDLNAEEKDIASILKKYSFEKLTGGRKQGYEDHKSHLRKGISGDWKNYLTGEHKKAFKEAAGQLLIDLGYENDSQW
jgi:hypothetical protein